MEWLELNIDTSHAGLDAVTDMLEQQGVTGLIIDDEADFQSFLENNRQYWDYVDEELLEQKKGVCRVTFYLERNEAAYGTVAAVRMAMSALKKEHPEYAPMLLTMEDAADEDWENNWKQFYKHMEIGTMDVCGTYPDRIAAGMALCGGNSLKDVSGLGKLPFWIIHGTADRAVPVKQSKVVVENLKKSGNDSRLLTLVAGDGSASCW